MIGYVDFRLQGSGINFKRPLLKCINQKNIYSSKGNFLKKDYICIGKEKINIKFTLPMSNNEVQERLNRLRIYFQQLHITVILEEDFINRLGSRRALYVYRDQILDNINQERRALGYI